MDTTLKTMKFFIALTLCLLLNPVYGESLRVGSFAFSIDISSNTELYRDESPPGHILTVVVRDPGQMKAPQDEKIIIQAIEVNSGGFTGSLEESLAQMSAGSGASIGGVATGSPKNLKFRRVPIYFSTFSDAEKIKGRCATVIYLLERGTPVRKFMLLTIFTNSVTPPTDDEIIQKLNAINFEPPDF